MTLDGKQLVTMDVLEEIVYASAPGDQLKATVYREGREFALTITMGEDQH